MPTIAQPRSLALAIILILVASVASAPLLCRVIDWATEAPPRPSIRLAVLLVTTSLWSLITYIGAVTYATAVIGARSKTPISHSLPRILAPVLIALVMDWVLVLYEASSSPIGLLEPSKYLRAATTIIYVAGLLSSTALLVDIAAGGKILVSLLAALTVLVLAGVSRLVAEYTLAALGAKAPLYACGLGAHGPGTALVAISPASLTGSALYVIVYVYSLHLLLSSRWRG